MSKLRTATALAGTTALLAVPLTTVLATPASAAERASRCDGARIELSVEKDDGRFEVEADVEDAPRGSRWRVKLTQDGSAFVNATATARAGGVSIDRDRPNSSGPDTFRFSVNRVGTSGSCALAITAR